MRRIYLDNNATTGVDPRVVDAMLSELSPIPANPSSIHHFGQRARSLLALARRQIASYFNVSPSEILFTSGGTETINMLLQGIQGHIISSDVEHSCIYNYLLGRYSDVTYLSTGSRGAVTAKQVQEAIKKNTSLIVLTAVNNETGVKTDIDAIGQIASEHKIPFIVDGVALLGKESFSLPSTVSAIAFSAHKFHGPKGVGFAIARSPLPYQPLLLGGDQEFTKRAGTENLAGILGLAKAIDLLKEELAVASKHMRKLQMHFESELLSRFKGLRINGHDPRICNTSNVLFEGVDGETLLLQLDLHGIAASHGSACASGALKPSRVLLNMGLSSEEAKSSIRFSFSRWTTEEEIDLTLDTLCKLIG